MGGNKDPRTTLEFLIFESNRLLTAIEASSGGGGGGTAVARTPSVVSQTTSGSTTSGVKSVSLLVQSSDAIIGGVSVPFGYAVSFSANGLDTVLPIAYDPGTGNIIITYLV